MRVRFISIVFLLFAFAKADTAAVTAADTSRTDSTVVADTTQTDTVAENPYGLPDELMPLWNSMSIKQKAAQMVMVYLSPAQFLIENEFGAVLVMKNHLKDTAAFKQRIREANEGLKIPLLVASDQEGGLVNRLGGISEKWKHAPSAKEMRDMSADSVKLIAEDIGGELMELGINMNLAPVLDPAKDHRPPQKEFLHGRERPQLGKGFHQHRKSPGLCPGHEAEWGSLRLQAFPGLRQLDQ